MSSHWRNTSRSTIANVIAQNQHLVTKEGLPELFKLVSKAYPFGQRAMHPYKMWCKEVGIARRCLEADLGMVERNPLYVKCRSCGAPRGVLCREIGQIVDDLMVAKDAELEGRPDDALLIRKSAFHDARLVDVGLQPRAETLPLFARMIG